MALRLYSDKKKSIQSNHVIQICCLIVGNFERVARVSIY